EGKTVEQVLGIEGAIAESTPDDPPRIVGEAEFRTMLPPGVDPDEAIATLLGAGIVVQSEQGFRVQHPAVVELGSEAVASGIPFAETAEEFVRLRGDLRGIAERFVGLYVRHVIEPFLAEGMP